MWFVPFTRQHARLADIITDLDYAGLALVARRPHAPFVGPGILFLEADSELPAVAEVLTELPLESQNNVAVLAAGFIIFKFAIGGGPGFKLLKGSVDVMHG